MRVTHAFNNPIPDRVGFSGTQPSHWNADHTIEGFDEAAGAAVNIVTLETFGATGEDQDADETALADAITYLNDNGGGTIMGKPGREYHFHKCGEPTGLTVTRPIVWNLNGAILKRPDAAMTANNERMILIRLTDSRASLHVFGGTIDANATGQDLAGLGQSDREQNSSIRVIAAGASVVVPFVRFSDLVMKDRWNWDHLTIVTISSGKIARLICENIRSETDQDWDLRADIIAFAGVINTTLRDVDVQRVETEFESSATERHIFDFKNVTCDDLQMGGTAASTQYIDMYMENVKAAKSWFVYGNLYDKYCQFGEIQDARIGTWRSTMSRFGVADTGLPLNAISSLPVDIDWYLDRPTFRLTDGPQTTTNKALLLPVMTTSLTISARIVLNRPDFLDDFGLIAECFGNVEIIEPKVKALGAYAFQVTGSANRVINVTIDGGDYSQCDSSTNPVSINSWNVSGYVLTLKGNWYGAESRVGTNGTINNDYIRNSRKVFAASDPASAVAGDELTITPPPSSGAWKKVAKATGGTPNWTTTITLA